MLWSVPTFYQITGHIKVSAIRLDEMLERYTQKEYLLNILFIVLLSMSGVLIPDLQPILRYKFGCHVQINDA